VKRSRALRVLSTLLMVAGGLLLLWAVVVWRWSDPVTGLYTRWEQRQLRSSFEDALRSEAARPNASANGTGSTSTQPRAPVPERARRFWHDTGTGQPVARLRIDRLGLDVIVVKGTDAASLKKGPGLDGRTAMPGEGELVYIAGHRTTYLAPFSHIDRLRKGDRISLTTPYARFEYVVTGHRIVRADDLSVLESPGHEVLALQACHPRFFATERYIVYALPRTPAAGAVEAGPVASSAAGRFGT
jgi:sortase A